MPSAWSLIDTSFPTFTGDERVRDQVDTILNYMFMLAEGLKYQLSNLAAENFNTTALRNIQIETTADVETALADMLKELDTVKNSVNTLRTGFARIEKWQQTANQKFEDLDETISGQTEAIEGLQALIRRNEDGSIAVGAEAVSLHLLGSVYINGKLLE